MKEDGNKHLRKQNILPIFEKDHEVDHIKKTLDKFLGKLMRSTTEKTFDLF